MCIRDSYYTAEAAQKRWGDAVRIDIFDRLPVPFGLIRSGVAPDHQSIKGVAKRYEAVALTDNVRFVGKVSIGGDVSVAELQGLYDALSLIHIYLETVGQTGQRVEMGKARGLRRAAPLFGQIAARAAKAGEIVEAVIDRPTGD